MSVTNSEAKSLFELKKYQADNIVVNFPSHGQSIEIEVVSENERFKFQADVNRRNTVDASKMTLQNRYNKTVILRRLDLAGSHQNPPGPAPNELLKPFEGRRFIKEDHLHLYIEGFGAKWAVPLNEFDQIEVKSTDQLFEKMERFFKYCNIISYKIQKTLF